MRDFKYSAAVSGGPTWAHHVMNLGLIKSKQLHSLISAFVENVYRTSSATIMPAMIAWQVRRDQVLSDAAMVRATGKLEPDLAQFDAEFDPGEKYRKEFESLATTFFKKVTPDQYVQMIAKYGVGYVSLLLEESKSMQTAMEALLAAVIIESWTAFESLASDLWATGVDAGSGDISARLLDSHKSFRSPEDNIGAKKSHEAGVNPKTHLGTFLRRTEKVVLQKIKEIQFWYGRAFGEDAAKLFDETANGYIFALAAVRNALVHNAGRADAKFIDLAQRFVELRQYKIEDAILLDGEIVKKLQEASHSLAVRLIRFVDSLLTADATA